MVNSLFESQSFQPNRLWRNRHLQTISRGLLRSGLRPSWRKIHLSTDYGDSLSVDVTAPEGPVRRRVLLLHGLTGCSGASPTPEVATILCGHGVESWALNLRGADRRVPDIPRLYHAGCSDDLEAIFSQLPQDLPWIFVGYSLGANLLLKWLGENPDRELPGAKALAISSPFEIGEVAANLEKSFVTKCYRFVLIHRLKSIVRRFADRYPCVLSHETISNCRTFYDFDQQITAPIHGFDGAEDYWRRCSSAQFLPSITIPTTLLHAKDDPFQPRPPTQVENDHLNWELYSHGGHLGFQQSWAGDWLVERIVQFALG